MVECHHSITCNAVTQQWNNHVFYHNGWGSCSGSAKAGSQPLLQIIRSNISYFQGEWKWEKPDKQRIFWFLFFVIKHYKSWSQWEQGKSVWCLLSGSYKSEDRNRDSEESWNQQIRQKKPQKSWNLGLESQMVPLLHTILCSARVCHRVILPSNGFP